MLQIVKSVDKRTGEIISDKRIEFEDILNEEGYKVPVHKLGAKIFSDVAFPDEITDTEIGKMTRLSKLMVAQSNMLGYRTRGGIKPYTRDQIIEIVKLSRRQGVTFISKMQRLGVMQKNIRLVEGKEVHDYYINPAYFFMGKRISLNLYLIFREHLDLIIPGWVRKEFLNAANEQVRP